MTTYADLYSTMNIQDGMEADFNHANNFQRFLRAQQSDQLVAQMVTSILTHQTSPNFGIDDGATVADVSNLWAYAVSSGRAFLRQGSANNKIQVAPGTLYQRIASADGNDSTLVAFTFAGTEEWTLASGDATNPRVDMLQMKLEYITDTPASVDFEDAASRALTTNAATATRRRVQATLTVKQGTPAASPTIPDPDAGFVPVGTAVVGHGWTSAGAAPLFGEDTAEANNVVIHDQRMPLGVRALVTEPATYKPTAWTLSADKVSLATSNATNDLYIRCQTNVGRVVAVDLADFGLLAPASAVKLGGDIVGSAATFRVRNSFGTNRLSSSVGRSRRVDFEASHSPVAGPTIVASAVKGYGVPLWASGYRTPQIPGTIGIPQFAQIRINNATNTPSSVWHAVFYIAG